MVKKILIVDDDPELLEAIDLSLTFSGFQVRPLLGSENILPMIDDFEPDLIILDYILKGITGGEVCRQLKNNPATKALPVIMLSAYPGGANAIKDVGCDAFIAKPLDIDYLVGKINACLNVSISGI